MDGDLVRPSVADAQRVLRDMWQDGLVDEGDADCEAARALLAERRCEVQALERVAAAQQQALAVAVDTGGGI